MAVTWNSADKHADVTLSAGDTTATVASQTSFRAVRATRGFDSADSTGRYFEILADQQAFGDPAVYSAFGVGSINTPLDNSMGADDEGWHISDNRIAHNNSATTGKPDVANDDIIGIAVRNGKIYFSINGTFIDSGDPTTEANPSYTNLTGTVYPMWAGRFFSPTSAIGVLRTALEDLTYLPSGFLPVDVYEAETDLQQAGVDDYQVSADLQQEVPNAYTVTADLEQGVQLLNYQVSADLEQHVAETYAAEADLAQSAYDDEPLFAASTVLQASVRLAGADVTEDLTGEIRIHARESAARTAEFAIEPAEGAVDVADWVDAAVIIDFLMRTRAASTFSRFRAFTGQVDEPRYDPVTGLVTFLCSDRLQQQFENTDRSVIDALTPTALWHETLFNADADGWEYLQDRLSTIPAAYDLDSHHLGHLTDWAAKETADYTYTAEDFDYGSLQTQEALGNDLHNVARVEFQYRFERLRQRDMQFGWRYPYTFCEYSATPSTLPDKDMIRGAVEGTGWLVRNLRFTPLWTTGEYDCGEGAFSWRNNFPQIVIGASMRLARRWSQTVTETHVVTVKAPQSIATFGQETASEVTATLASDYDYEEWEGQNANNALAVAGDRSDVSYDLNAEESYEPPDGSVQDANEDWVYDAGDRQDFEDAIETAMARAATAMKAVHRQNYVTWSAPLNPALELYHTVRLECDRVTAQGKASHLIHALDLESGEGTTEIQISVSRSGSSSVQNQTLSAPPQPDSLVELAELPDPPTLGSQFGGLLASPPYDEDLDGYSGNHQLVATASTVYEGVDPDTGEVIDPDTADGNAVEAGSEIYPTRFQITMPEIEESLREAKEVSQERTYTISIPNETLTITH